MKMIGTLTMRFAAWIVWTFSVVGKNYIHLYSTISYVILVWLLSSLATTVFVDVGTVIVRAPVARTAIAAVIRVLVHVLADAGKATHEQGMTYSHTLVMTVLTARNSV
jgi:hypothetical protein